MNLKATDSNGGLFSLSDRTIILTGGLGGLGISLTATLLNHGADIVSTDLAVEPSSQEWQSLLEVSERTKCRLSYVQCDVTDEASVKLAFQKAVDGSRHLIRGLVALAGISGRSPAVEYDIAAFRKIMDINVTGTFLCARETARICHRQQTPGSIVLFASMSGTNVNRGVDTCAYNASKAAVLQLARNLAAEWGSQNSSHPPIRVNTISPGYIMTPITMPTLELMGPELQKLWKEGNMMSRLSTVEEHQSSVVFLLADSSSYMTGADLRVDGGHCAW